MNYFCKIECQNDRKKIYLNDLYPVEERKEEQDVYDWEGDQITGNNYYTGGASWWLNQSSSSAVNCIDVLRYSDDVIQTFGFDTLGNLLIDEIEDFLGNSYGLVAKLYDQSGNENHLKQHLKQHMPYIADENGKVYLRNCKPCMLFFDEDEVGGKWMYLERELDLIGDVANGLELNAIQSNISMFTVAELIGDGHLVSKGVIGTPGFPNGGSNNFSLSSTLGYADGGDPNSLQVLTDVNTSTVRGDLNIWNYFLTSEPDVSSPQFPSGARQQIKLEKYNEIRSEVTLSFLIRPENTFLQGPVPFTLGASLDNSGSYINWINRSGFMNSTITNTNTNEITNGVGFQGLQYYTSNKKSDKFKINQIINLYWKAEF